VLPKTFSDADLEQLFKCDPVRLRLLQRTRPALFWDLEKRALALGLITQLTQSGAPETKFKR
jgi:hypothetical protein